MDCPDRNRETPHLAIDETSKQQQRTIIEQRVQKALEKLDKINERFDLSHCKIFDVEE